MERRASNEIHQDEIQDEMQNKIIKGRSMMKDQNQTLRDGIRKLKEANEIGDLTEARLDDQGKQINKFDKKSN